MERHQQVLTRTGPSRSFRARGLTLLEMTFSMAVFTVVIMTLYGFMMTQAMVSTEEFSELKTQHDTCMGVESLLTQLETCRLHRIDSMGAWVQYSLPKVDATTGGFQLDANGNLIFGVDVDGTWYAGGFWSAAFVRSNESTDYLKEQDMILQRTQDTITLADGSTQVVEKKIGMDLNGNGYLTDIFIGGYIQLTPYNSLGVAVGTPRQLNGKYFMELDPLRPMIVSHATNYHGRLQADDYDSEDAYTYATTGSGNPETAYANRVMTMRYKNQGIFLLRHLNGTNAHKADPALGSEGIDCDNFVDSNDNYIKDATENPVNNFQCSISIRLVTFDTTRNLTKTGEIRDQNYGLRVSSTRVKLKN